MSSSYHGQFHDPEPAEPLASEADLFLNKVRVLQDELVSAWQERAVVLSKSEQHELRVEIVKTCDLLAGLVGLGNRSGASHLWRELTKL